LAVITGSSFAKFTITPGINIRESYDDNVFLTDEDEESDFITHISPNVSLTYAPGKLLDLSLDYALDFRIYSDLDELNDTNPKETQNLRFKAQARPVNYIFIDVYDRYQRVAIDARRRTLEGNAFVNKTMNNVFTVSPSIVYPLTSTISTTIGYSYSDTWFEKDEAIDFYSHSAFMTLSKRFSSKISAELRYNFYGYRTDSAETAAVVNDYDRHQGSAALICQITPSIKVSGEAGETRFDFTDKDDSDTTFYYVEGEYKAKVSTRVYYRETFQDAVISGTYKKRELGGSFEIDRPLGIRVGPYHRIDKYINLDREDETNGAAVRVSYPLSSRISVVLRGIYEKEEFRPEDEKADEYSLESSLEYIISPKILASIGYTYSEKDSNVETNDYVNNVIWLEGRLTF